MGISNLKVFIIPCRQLYAHMLLPRIKGSIKHKLNKQAKACLRFTTALRLDLFPFSFSSNFKNDPMKISLDFLILCDSQTVIMWHWLYALQSIYKDSSLEIIWSNELYNRTRLFLFFFFRITLKGRIGKTKK